MLAKYGKEWIVQIKDVTDFVKELSTSGNRGARMPPKPKGKCKKTVLLLTVDSYI